MSKKLEDFDSKTLGINPFTYSLTIPVTRMQSDAFKLLPADVEGQQGTFIKDSFVVENVQTTRLYYCQGCKDMVYNLSDKAQRLFIYILYNLERKKDYVQINKDHYMRKNGIKSNTTYVNAVDELVRYGFLQLTKYKSVYWTNPFLFSSGDRIKMYPNNLEERSDLSE